MATKTTLFELTKPAQNEAADINIINSNTDLIDAALGQRSRVPNLVINGNFMPGYIVNQRGESSYPGAKYGVDMWKGTTSASTISVTSEGLAITHGGTSGYAMAMQRFPDHIYSAYKDSVLTIAACLSDGTVAAKSGIPSNGSFNASFGDGFSAQLYAPSGETYIGVRLMNGTPGSTVTLRWVAVYPGAYTVDTLPEYQPKSYVETLMECSRYVNVFDYDFIYGRSVSTTAFLYFPTLVRMADVPTITVQLYGQIRANSTSVTPKAFSVNKLYKRGVYVEATYDSATALSYHVCVLNNAIIVLSCEPT